MSETERRRRRELSRRAPPDSAAAMEEALDALDRHQLAATTSPPGPLLVVAGAGSGKTRVLTHRAAWMVACAGFPASQVLAVTFTNKAAQEMAERVERLLGEAAAEVTIGTVHSICHHMVRPFAARVGRSPAFSILSERDSYRLLEIAREEAGGILTHSLAPATLYGHISLSKALYYTPRLLRERGAGLHREVADVWDRYRGLCREVDGLDFADLVVAATWLLGREEGARELYQRRYRAVLVDECQDLSRLEREWVRRVAAPEFNVTFVGDDDQTVFAWRGARSAYMLAFRREYPGGRVVVLPLNYRSSVEVVAHAKRLIDNQEQRIAKDLRAARRDRGIVAFAEHPDEWEEAHAVAAAIEELRGEREVGAGQIAVLVRGNGYLGPIERALAERRIPYELLRGTKFWDRREVRDSLAFAHLAANPRHRVAFERAVRCWSGLGEASAKAIIAHASARGLPLVSALADAGLAARYAEAARRLGKRVGVIRSLGDRGQLGEAMRLCISSTGHERRLRDRSDAASVEALRRLHELGEQAEAFAEVERGADLMALLSELSLARASAVKTSAGAVSVGTIHSAKGLEWPITFVLGAIEGELPAAKALKEGELAGERRVMYVAMTRAGYELRVSFPARHRGRVARPSRFIAEALGGRRAREEVR